MNLTKTLKFDPDTLDILTHSFQVEPHGSGFIGKLTCGQLDRKAYENVNKALEALGGKWNRKAGGHIFTTDPREQLSGLIDNGSLKVTKEGWFPTPDSVIAQMYELAPYDGHGFVLEPSAGEGAIIDYIAHKLPGRQVSKRIIECVELNPQRAEVLRQKNCVPIEADFLTTTLDTFGLPEGFCRVYMNPPFENGQDIDHVRHAYNLLSPGGILVSVMSEGVFFRDDNKAKEFRAWLESAKGYSIKLPSDAFKPSGTGVQTRLAVARKSGASMGVKATQASMFREA